MPREYTSFDRVKALKETDLALLVRFSDGDVVWIPKSQISPASEVQDPDDEGELSVTEWFAVENELE